MLPAKFSSGLRGQLLALGMNGYASFYSILCLNNPRRRARDGKEKGKGGQGREGKG